MKKKPYLKFSHPVLGDIEFRKIGWCGTLSYCNRVVDFQYRGIESEPNSAIAHALAGIVSNLAVVDHRCREMLNSGKGESGAPERETQYYLLCLGDGTYLPGREAAPRITFGYSTGNIDRPFWIVVVEGLHPMEWMHQP